jgi:hypothetical protein
VQLLIAVSYTPLSLAGCFTLDFVLIFKFVI